MFELNNDDIFRRLGFENHKPEPIKMSEHCEPTISTPSLTIADIAKEQYALLLQQYDNFKHAKEVLLYYTARGTVCRADYDKLDDFTELKNTLARNQLSESSTSIGHTAFISGLEKEIKVREQRLLSTYSETKKTVIDALEPLTVGELAESITLLTASWRNNRDLKDRIKSQLEGQDKVVIVNSQPYKLFETSLLEFIQLAKDYDENYTSEKFIEITALLKDLEDRIKDSTFINILSKCISTEEPHGLVLEPTLRQLLTVIYQDTFINEIDILRAEVLKHFNLFKQEEEVNVDDILTKILCVEDTIKDTDELLLTLNHLAGTMKRIELIGYVTPVNY